jgi:hypothetical protein
MPDSPLGAHIIAQLWLHGQVLRVAIRLMGTPRMTRGTAMTTPHTEDPAEGPDDPATSEPTSVPTGTPEKDTGQEPAKTHGDPLS